MISSGNMKTVIERGFPTRIQKETEQGTWPLREQRVGREAV